MSRDWTPDELQAASRVMKEAGHMSYEEFCEELPRMAVGGNAPASPGNELQQPFSSGDR